MLVILSKIIILQTLLQYSKILEFPKLYHLLLLYILRATHDDTGPSGYGFELTFRLRRLPGEDLPPTWPAELMQNLAKYVFKSGKHTKLLTFS